MKRFIMVFLFVILFISISSAESKFTTEAEFIGNHITNADYFTISGKTGVKNLVFQEITTEKEKFIRLSADKTTYFTSEIGKPELPVISRLIEIPFGAVPEIEIISYKEKTISLENKNLNSKIYPVQPSCNKNENPKEKKLVYDKNFYSKKGFYGEIKAEIEYVGVMRNTSLARITIYPFSYSPSENVLKTAYEIEYRINLKNSDPEKTKKMKQKYSSKFFSPVLKDITLYENGMKENITEHEFYYLIISYPSFADEMEQFINWKKEKGFHVIHKTTDEIGSTKEAIDNYIENLYLNSSTPPDFILLAGDKDQIPAWIGQTSSQYTDLYYACVGNEDHIPDIYIGRFSANNINELIPQIEKTIWYEKTQYENPENLNYLQKALLVAGENSMGTYHLTHGNGQIRYLTENYFNSAHNIMPDTFLAPGTGQYSDGIINMMNEGRGIYNYTAHGGISGFSNPSYNTDDVELMTNTGKYPLVIGNCCLTNSFQANECFGESWLRKENGGGIGYIGGSANTQWNEDYWWAVGYYSGSIDGTAIPYEDTDLGAFDGLFHDHSEPITEWYTVSSAMIFRGNLSVQASTSSRKLYYWETYNLMGDPSITPALGVQEEMNPLFDQLYTGITLFQIDTGTPNALVSITREGEIKGTGLTDMSGTCIVEFSSPITEGEYHLCITSQNKYPYITDLTAAPGINIELSSQEIPVNTPFTLTINITDGLNEPVNGIEIIGSGFNYTTDTAETGEDGTAQLEINYPYGPELILRGYESGNNVPVFSKTLEMTGSYGLINPNAAVSSEFGLTDTLAMNLSCHAEAQSSSEGISFWSLNPETGELEIYPALETDYTALSLDPVPFYITKPGFNVYTKSIPVIEARGRVQGYIRDDSGSGISEAAVILYNADNEAAAEMVTDSEGFFRTADKIVCGNYYIDVIKFGYAPYFQEIFADYELSEHSVTLYTAESARIRGYINHNNIGVSGAVLEVFRTDTKEKIVESVSNIEGYYEADLPCFGHYMIKISKEGFLPLYTEDFSLEENLLGYFDLEEFSGIYLDFEEDNGGLESNNPQGWQWGEDEEAGSVSGSKVWGTALNGSYGIKQNLSLTVPEVFIEEDWVLNFYHWHEFEYSNKFQNDEFKSVKSSSNDYLKTSDKDLYKFSKNSLNSYSASSQNDLINSSKHFKNGTTPYSNISQEKSSGYMSFSQNGSEKVNSLSGSSSGYLKYSQNSFKDSKIDLYDGGNIKYSDDGGNTWNILHSFITDSIDELNTEEEYAGVLSNQWENPLGGEYAFGGYSENWLKIAFDISEYSGKNLMFKFDFGSDKSQNRLGWYIDDLFIGPSSPPIEPPFNPDTVGEVIPKSFALKQNYPNPFNPQTNIEIHLTKRTSSELKIYSVTGQLVRTLHIGEKGPGIFRFIWNGRNDDGRTVSTGVYYYVLKAGDYREVRKMLLIK